MTGRESPHLHFCVPCRVPHAIYIVHARRLAFAYHRGPHDVHCNEKLFVVSGVTKLTGHSFPYVTSELYVIITREHCIQHILCGTPIAEYPYPEEHTLQESVRCILGESVRCIHGESVCCIHGESVRCIHGESVRCIHGESVRCIHGESVRCIHGESVRCIHGTCHCI